MSDKDQAHSFSSSSSSSMSPSDSGTQTKILTSLLLPETVYVSGLPLFLCGWNMPMTMTSAINEGCPIYHLNGYLLYPRLLMGGIPIEGITLRKMNGVWIIHRDDDYGGRRSFISKVITEEQDTPFGSWTVSGSACGAKVTSDKPWPYLRFLWEKKRRIFVSLFLRERKKTKKRKHSFFTPSLSFFFFF